MINNRLFKKINSIFWGILGFLPIVICLFGCFKTHIGTGDLSYTSIFSDMFNGIIELNTEWNMFYNPLSGIISNLLDTIFGNSFLGSAFGFVVECGEWLCSVLLIRLFVYVFYWFIDLISGLFDLMTFNRKGDN